MAERPKFKKGARALQRTTTGGEFIRSTLIFIYFQQTKKETLRDDGIGSDNNVCSVKKKGGAADINDANETMTSKKQAKRQEINMKTKRTKQ